MDNQSGLFPDTFHRFYRQILFWVRYRHQSFFYGMDEMVMATVNAYQFPTIGLNLSH